VRGVAVVVALAAAGPAPERLEHARRAGRPRVGPCRRAGDELCDPGALGGGRGGAARLCGREQRGRGPVGLLVLRVRGEWLKVRLPDRPNRAAGWIAADRVVLRPTRWRVVINVRARRVTVLRDGRPVRRFAAVVGAPGTPTPRGRFAIYEIDRQPDPFGFLGPVALHLTAHSDVLDDYGGGPGRVALHGRGGASLLDPLGSAASHGCIRVDSREAAWLARKVQPGVPVTIT
jgi:hypothetical protein